MMNKLALRAGAFSLFGGSVYIVSNRERKRKALSYGLASYRILNLFGTAAVIAADYSVSLNLYGSKAHTEYNKLLQKLEKFQTDSEFYTKKLIAKQSETDVTGIPHEDEIGSLKARLREIRNMIDETSQNLAELNKKGRSSNLAQVHYRSAARLRQLCMKNKGVYIKLGQHLSQLDYLLPEEYIVELEPLLAQNPESSWDSVVRIFQEDFGQAPEEVFDVLNKRPIASASLAQVHIGYDKLGRKCAVKIQHEDLQEGSIADRAAITFVVDIVSSIFEGFSYRWLTREMNKNLPLELDFMHEAENLKKCKILFEGNTDVAIPQVYESLSSKRVLCMSYEEGTYVTDLEGIKKMGLEARDVAKTVSRIFADQIFKFGFVHCDPHQNNLLVRKHPAKRKKPQVVLLDHGIYRELNDDFRMHYCKLWRAIIMGDETEIQKYCAYLNAGPIYTLLAAVLTMKPWDDIISKDMRKLEAEGTAAEAEMLKSYAKKYFLEIVQLLGSVPSELLLLLKTNDCLRHLDKALGVPANTASITASVTASVCLKEEIKKNHSFREYLESLRTYFQIRLRVLALQLIETFPQLIYFV